MQKFEIKKSIFARSSIEIKYENVDEYQIKLSEISEFLFSNDVIIDKIFHPFLLCVIDNNIGDIDIQFNKTKNQLFELFSKNIKLLHGKLNCHIGNFALGDSFNYGVLIPKIAEKLSKLNELEFGKSNEDSTF